MLATIVNGKEIILTDEEEAALRAEWAANDAAKADYEATLAYRDKRAEAYPKIGDQLDYLYKTFAYLKENGLEIGTFGEEWLAAIDNVKSTYPKPT